ncbi:MAG: winged helix-turn-helix domain-containing protein [Nanoarchaeota archaeon]|nr:winged helix-turn-helix domain-containing protein [Nanoarchaeota archaeon]
MTWLKKGNQFLIEISKQELNRAYNIEKNAKAKLRLLAALRRKEGNTLENIAYSLQKPKTTIHDWLKRLEENGVKMIYDIKQPGKPARLTKQQLDELEKVLNDSPQKQNLPFVMWTTKLIQYIIIKLFCVKYELWNVGRIVKKMGFNLKVPRQEHKKANKKAQEKFKIELKKKFNIILNLDSRSFVLMKHISL